MFDEEILRGTYTVIDSIENPPGEEEPSGLTRVTVLASSRVHWPLLDSPPMR